MEYDHRIKDKRIQRTKDRRAMLWRTEEEHAHQQIQTKLEIGASDDIYEQHADAVAQKVVSGQDASSLVKNQPTVNNALQTKSESDTPVVTDQLQTTLNSSKGGGQNLDTNTQNEMGEKMGVDLSDVKIHTDSKANEMSEGINAKAFTHGQDIYFKQGNFDTNSNQGKELLAHELTHTQQQKSGVQRKIQRTVDLSAVGVMLKAFMLAQPTTWIVKGLLQLWYMIPEEDRIKMINDALDKKIGELKMAEKAAPPTWVKIASSILSGGGMSLSPVPSMETMWPLIITGELGYFEHLRNLSNPFLKKEGAGKVGGAVAGKSGSVKAPVTPSETTVTPGVPAGMVKNPDYKKGGYAKLLEQQMENMIDPQFMLGQISGVFIGIYNWFKDIVLMIWDLLKFLWESIQSAWNTIQEMWTTATTGKPPQWIMDLLGPAKTAAQWLKENSGMMIKFIVHLIKDPTAAKQLGADIKNAVFSAAKSMARSAGAAVAKAQAKFMSESAFEQGKTMGSMVGYLIPEIVLAVFTGSIGNWIKGGLKAFQASRAGLKLLKGMKWLAGLGKTLFAALEKFGGLIKKMASGTFEKLGDAFGKVLDFLKGLTKWGDEVPVPKKTLGKGEILADNLGWPKPEPGYKWVDRGDGVPNYERTSKLNPEREYDPVKKEFRDKPVKDTPVPKNVIELWKKYLFNDLGKKAPCFPPGTLIKTPNGDIVIEDIKPGTKVFAFNLHSGKIIIETVTETFVNWTEKLMEIVVDGESIKSTYNHNFWVESELKWLPAVMLKEGMKVQLLNNSLASIHKITSCTEVTNTFNFEVANEHNYFVGEKGILVHNKSGFEDLTKNITYIYEIFDPKTGKVVYVGQTVDLDRRMKDHLLHPEKAHWKTDGYRMRPAKNGSWTSYEASVWERHFIEKNGGLNLLENKSGVISIDKFEEFKHLHNPCK